MQKFVFLFLFFVATTCDAFAGTTTLTTYYPPPTAAYNQVKLSINYTLAPSCAAPNGTNGPNGTIGTIVSDSNGTLSVCMKNSQGAYSYVVYPQECYNVFCSYTTGGTACTPTCPGGPGGFLPIVIDGANRTSEPFQTSTTTTVISIVCCSAS